jgi:multidrug resistance efflux pump
MQRSSRIMNAVIVVLILAVAGAAYYSLQATADSQPLTLSGTIEATEIRLASQVGGRVQEVDAAEGDPVRAGQTVIAIYSAVGSVNEKITSPIDGVVLDRLIQPGELAAPGSTLMVVADLNALTLKVYVPEERYGQVSLGQIYPVTVDSFPGQTFSGRVSHIADRAEFTPRNVQTVEGRKSTVFAVTLDLVSAGGKLKPGMPADVGFQPQ